MKNARKKPARLALIATLALGCGSVEFQRASLPGDKPMMARSS